MSFEQKKGQLLDELQAIKEQISFLKVEELDKQIDELLSDIQSDFHTVVVVGEFKNGKSTFINALLHESLLPVDVTPTTATINALMWGKQRSLQVYKSDGTVEQLNLTREALEEYVAEKDFAPETINYLKIKLPVPLLANKNVVLVDTPGVNDLNSHRSDVTYQFIPKADVVLFMLDMTAPVKMKEKVFLKETLLKDGLDRIIFMANFMDLVEEEEIDSTMDYTRNRLIEILGHSDVKLYPVSAQTAIDALETEDEELLEWSGIPKVQSAIQHEIESGNQIEIRWNRYMSRAKKIYNAIEKQIKQKQKLSTYTIEELQSELVAIKENYEKKDDNRYKIENYVIDREQEFLFMIHKSLDTFARNVKEEMEFMIQTYKSTDIKEFVEDQLPLYMKKQFKRWIEEHIDQIHTLFFKLEQALAEGLAKEFNTQIKLQIEQKQLLKTSGDHLEITVNDISNTSILAGLIAGGAGALMMVVGGPLFLPLIGMAGYPILQKKLVEKRLNDVKAILLSEIGPTLDQIIASFRHEVDGYVKNHIHYISDQATIKFEEQMSILQKSIETTIEKRLKSQDGIKDTLIQLEELSTYLSRLQMTHKEIHSIGGHK